MNKIGYPFLVTGIVFVAIGISGQRTLLYAGVVFVLIGMALVGAKPATLGSVLQDWE